MVDAPCFLARLRCNVLLYGTTACPLGINSGVLYNSNVVRTNKPGKRLVYTESSSFHTNGKAKKNVQPSYVVMHSVKTYLILNGLTSLTVPIVHHVCSRYMYFLPPLQIIGVTASAQ